eukprot:scaffold54935_cov32-Tisochrysis_lutea.AAC.1
MDPLSSEASASGGAPCRPRTRTSRTSTSTTDVHPVTRVPSVATSAAEARGSLSPTRTSRISLSRPSAGPPMAAASRASLRGSRCGSDAI